MKLTQGLKVVRYFSRGVLPALFICFFAMSALSRGDDSHAVTAKPGETVENNAITAGRVVWIPDYSEKRMIPEVIVGTPAADPVVLNDTVISRDTIRKGERIIQGMLSGRFLAADNTPLSGALLYLYNLSNGPVPSQDRYWRVPTFPVEIGADGRFNIPAPPGEYCIAAIRRADRVRIGPPEAGDIFMISEDEAGMPKKYVLKSGEDLDLGDIRQTPPVAGRKKPNQLNTAIEGHIRDYDGKALEGVMVFAFTTPDIVGKPLFASGRSDRDGNFLLQLFEGGTFYLKTRNALGGGPPQSGNLIDGNKLEAKVQVSVNTGETVRGVVLKTKKFPGRGRNKDI